MISACAAASRDDLLERMAAVNPDLHTFTATIRAHVTLKSFPFLSADLDGTYYYKEPDKNKVVFTSGVPTIAQQFDKLYAHVDGAVALARDVRGHVVSDDGSTTRFRLVPRKRGNVSEIDATADDKTATVDLDAMELRNGGYAEMNNRYGRVGGNYVVQAQTGHVEEPGYVADITSTIDDYKINPTLPDGVFGDGP